MTDGNDMDMEIDSGAAEEMEDVGRVFWGPVGGQDLGRMLFVDEEGVEEAHDTERRSRSGSGRMALPPTQVTASTLALRIRPDHTSSTSLSGSTVTPSNAHASSSASTSTLTKTSRLSSYASGASTSTAPIGSSHVHIQRRPQRRNRSLPLASQPYSHRPSPTIASSGTGETGSSGMTGGKEQARSSGSQRSTSSPYPLNHDQSIVTSTTSGGGGPSGRIGFGGTSGVPPTPMGKPANGTDGIHSPSTSHNPKPHDATSPSDLIRSIRPPITPRAAKMDSLISLIEKRLTRSASRRSVTAGASVDVSARGTARQVRFGRDVQEEIVGSPRARNALDREETGPGPFHLASFASRSPDKHTMVDNKTPPILPVSAARRRVLGMRRATNAPDTVGGRSEPGAGRAEGPQIGFPSEKPGFGRAAQDPMNHSTRGSSACKRVQELSGTGKPSEASQNGSRNRREWGKENLATEVPVDAGTGWRASQGEPQSVAETLQSARIPTDGTKNATSVSKQEGRLLPMIHPPRLKEGRSARPAVPPTTAPAQRIPPDDRLSGLAIPDDTANGDDVGNDSLESIDDGMDGFFSAGGDEVDALLMNL